MADLISPIQVRHCKYLNPFSNLVYATCINWGFCIADYILLRLLHKYRHHNSSSWHSCKSSLQY